MLDITSKLELQKYLTELKHQKREFVEEKDTAETLVKGYDEEIHKVEILIEELDTKQNIGKGG